MTASTDNHITTVTKITFLLPFWVHHETCFFYRVTPERLKPPSCCEVKGHTTVLIFDGEAEDVSSPEAGAVIDAAVEERVGVGVLDVQDLTGGCHVTSNTLISWDTELLLLTGTIQRTLHQRKDSILNFFRIFVLEYFNIQLRVNLIHSAVGR